MGVPRRRFTLRDLLVAVTVLCVLLGIGVMVLSVMRTRADRIGCSDRLRNWGVTVHIYHDYNNQLPPLASADQGWSWVAFLSTFVEVSDSVPPDPDPKLHLSPAAGAARPWVKAWGAGVPEFMLCPARRIYAQHKGGVFSGGCPTDFVAVSSSTSKAWSTTSDGMIVLCRKAPTLTSPVVSATTLVDVTDGLANTAMIGEKHMHPAWLAGPLDEPAVVAFNGPQTMRLATDRAGGHRLAGPESNNRWAFGSWHPGMTHFAMGDGSVRAVNNETSPRVLRLLTGRNDGLQFELK